MGAKLSGGGDGSRYTVDQNSDINVTPFVDIMLVLLIIFMVSIPVATVSIKLDLPPAVDGPKPDKDPVFISIQENGDIYIAEKQTSLETLAGDLSTAFGTTSTEERVMVRASPEVSYEKFMEVLNQLQDDGYFKIGLINEDIS